jgi:23S rRNA pseudouridine1911/1915/1917 synthase
VIGRGRDLSERREKLVVPVRATECQRLDVYLGNHLNWSSRTRLQSLIRDGRVLVNGEPAKPARKVRAGDMVTLELSGGAGIPADYGDLPLEVLYEDPWLVAVSKPPGLLVHPVGRHVYDTLINYLHHRYRGHAGEDGRPVVPRLCHRIDRDTTGVLVAAKEAWTHREVQAAFERRRVAKEYVALAVGRYPEERSTLDAPIGEGRSLETCLEHAALKASETSVRVLARFEEHTLLACVPHTGRQNQIRVHLAAAGHPIAGDDRYGGGRPPGGFPPRYLLHSRLLRFHHPRLKCAVEVTAPLPADFQALLDRLAAPPRA